MQDQPGEPDLHERIATLCGEANIRFSPTEPDPDMDAMAARMRARLLRERGLTVKGPGGPRRVDEGNDSAPDGPPDA
jgi:hypothetical protein